MKGKDLISVTDLSPETVHQLIENAWELKNGRHFDIPKGRVLALLFEKPSLRTRVSFETAMMGLGGRSLYLSPAEVGLGKRESIADVARVLSRYVDVITARTFSHQTVKELAAHCSVPVINALSDYEHPCQALADMLTILEKKGGLKGVKIAYIGDGNNVANSLVMVSAMLGVDFTIAAPSGYRLDENILNRAREYARLSGSRLDTLEDPHLAVKGADVIYTDTWTSMGQEQEREQRIRDFRDFQVNSNLLCSAPERVIVMHCLPAHRGEEITDDIIDGPHSVV
ncbi:MAG: ornithine carbamoyltransferase, partial [Dehalococcoidaceae bacterium]|nr:ornithine carbamoyltransferase [Dehalococcoidaceae bacterium]